MFLLWAIVFLTARYLVSVLGKAQRRGGRIGGLMPAERLKPGSGGFSPASIGPTWCCFGWFVFSLFPLVWLVLLSLKSESEQISTYFTFSPTLRLRHGASAPRAPG